MLDVAELPYWTIWEDPVTGVESLALEKGMKSHE